MRGFLISALILCVRAAAAQTVFPPTTNATATIGATWTASTTPGVAYGLWMGTNAGQYFTNFYAGTNLSLTVSNLARGQTYYFAVTAQLPAGTTSAYSAEASGAANVIPAGATTLHLTWTVP